MKILIYGINFSPEAIGIGKYTGEMAYWLANKGHEVRVVAAPPYYPDWRVSDGFINRWEIQTELVDDRVHHETKVGGCTQRVNGSLQIWRCPLWVPTTPSGLKRLLHLGSFALTSFPIMLRQMLWRPDVVWVVAPALFCAPTAALVARLIGARAWLHVQDFEVDVAFKMGILNGNKLRLAVSWAERWLMQRFDVVSTISKQMHKKLLQKGVAPSAARVMVNWADMNISTLPMQTNHLTYRNELGIESDAIIAMYSGNMGSKQGLEILAELAKRFAVDLQFLQSGIKLVFVFCGNGVGRENLLSLCEGLTNVRFLHLQPIARLADFLGMANIHLLPQRADVADLVMPSKLTGILASGRPVVASAQPGTELWSVLQTCGLTVPPQDVAAMAHAVQRLARDQDLCRALGANGFKYAATNYNKNITLESFETDLIEMIG